MSWARSSSSGLLLALTALGPAWAGASERPTSAQAEPAAVAGLRIELSARCGEQVRAELLEGRRRDDACGGDREAAGRALVHRRDAFGFVEQREVGLASLRLVLGEARRCRQWPLRRPDRDVLRRTEVDHAGCRLRRHQGEVPLVLVDREGRRHDVLPPLRTDRDGRVELRFATLDRMLRALGEGTLDDYARIELGEAGWAGHVDLEQLLRFRADWHLTWLLRGRGTPGLFAARHPEHPRADDARTWAAEALLQRQASDYERVEAGELSPRAFLDRYPSSPYRRRLESRPGGRPSKAATASDDQPGGTSPGGASPGGATAPRDDSSGDGGGRRGGTIGGIGP